MMKRFSWRLSILAVALAASAGSASAHTTNCTGVLNTGTYDNVNVPAGKTCSLRFGTNVTVTGNVTVEAGASLEVPRGFGPPIFLVVYGSLLSTDAAAIVLFAGNIPPVNVSILGSVLLTGEKSGGTNEIAIIDAFIGGNLSIVDSNLSSGLFEVSHNGVAGNVLVQNNTSGSTAVISNNAIGGSLVCVGNTPAPYTPPPNDKNTIGGNAVGQCAGF